MRNIALPRLLPVLTLAFPLAAQASSVQDRILQEGLENSHVMQFQDHLCNDIGARLTGSDSFTVACEWARDEFQKMGLDARLEKWDEWKLTWNRGQWSGRVLEPIQLELQVATPAWTAGTKGRVAGALVPMPESAEELESLRPRLGSVYLYGRLPRSREGFAVELRDALRETPPLGTVMPSRMGGVDPRYENQMRVFGNYRVAMGKWESRPTTPEIVVRDDQAKQIEKLLEDGTEVLVEFDIRNRFRDGGITLNNVIADIPGTEKPDEYVIVCGHLDSWHQATGATDNGTGTTSTLEAARILAAVGAKPKRTIRFILWGGEEQGLLGSQKYVVMHRQDMNKVSAVLNHDTGTNWAHSLTVTEAMYDDFKKVLEPVMAMTPPEAEHDGRVFNLRKTASLGGFGGSDHASFIGVGVPAWSWGLKGRSEYGYGWHSQWDTYDIVVPEYQRHTATVIALTALGLADLDHLLSREGVKRGGGQSQGLAGLIDSQFGMAIDDDLVVTKVVAKGPAERAGLKKGDVLVALWDRELKEPLDVYRAWRNYRDEEAIEFTCRRGDQQMTLKTEWGGGGDESKGGAEKKAPPAEKRKAGVPR